MRLSVSKDGLIRPELRRQFALLRTFSLKTTKCRIQSDRCCKIMFVPLYPLGWCGVGECNRQLSLSTQGPAEVSARRVPK
jgi:hypothetical protein